MTIHLLTMLNGDIVLNKQARPGVALEEILEIAECEVFGGYADYSRVTVNGELYAEYES